MGKPFYGFRSGLLLCHFFAAGGAACHFFPHKKNRHGKTFIMIRTGLFFHRISRRLIVMLLTDFLQPALGVISNNRLQLLVIPRFELLLHKGLDRHIAPVLKDGADHRFIGAGQD